MPKKKLSRILLILSLLSAEAFGKPIKSNYEENMVNPKYVEYYVKQGYPKSIAEGLASVIEHEGGSIPAPRTGDEFGRVGFSVTNRSHLYPKLGLDKRDYKSKPVTEEEALSWIPQQFEGWRLKEATNMPTDIAEPLLNLGYLSNPSKSRDAFNSALSGQYVALPTDFYSPRENERDRLSKHLNKYHMAAGINYDGSPDGSTSSSRKASVSYSPSKRYAPSGDIDLTSHLLPPSQKARNDKSEGFSTNYFPLDEAPPRPKSAYREFLERVVRGDSLNDLLSYDTQLQELQNYAKKKYPAKK